MRAFDRRLLRHGRASRSFLVVTAVVAAALAALVVVQAVLLASIITRVFLDGAGFADIAPQLGQLLAVVVARAGLRGLREGIARVAATRVKAALRRDVLAHAVELGPTYLSGERRGELVATTTTGIDALDSYYAGYLPQLVESVVAPVVVLAWIAPIDLAAVVIMAVTLPLIPTFMALIGVGARSVAARQWQTMGRLSAHFLDVVEGLATLRVFGRAGAQTDTLARVGEEYRSVTMRTLRISFLSSFVLELAATLSVAIVAVAVGLRVLNGSLGLEAGLTVLILAPEVYLPLRRVGVRFHESMEGLAACDRIFSVLETPAPAASGSSPVPDPSRAVIRFDDVSFTYPDRSPPVVSGVTFELGAGERVALIGPSGAGKSTLAALLLRFSEPDAGRILLGGHDLAGVSRAAWWSRIAWVPQRPHLLTASVADNVRLGRAQASDDEVRIALERANAADLVASLPDGIDTELSERASTLSAGERQRVALARAFVRDAPLVVLDEPTAHLDAESELAVIEAMDRLLRGRSALLITHRPNVAGRADRSIVLDEGRIVAEPVALTRS